MRCWRVVMKACAAIVTAESYSIERLHREDVEPKMFIPRFAFVALLYLLMLLLLLLLRSLCVALCVVLVVYWDARILSDAIVSDASAMLSSQVEIPLDRVIMGFFFSPDSKKLLCLVTEVSTGPPFTHSNNPPPAALVSSPARRRPCSVEVPAVPLCVARRWLFCAWPHRALAGATSAQRGLCLFPRYAHAPQLLIA